MTVEILVALELDLELQEQKRPVLDVCLTLSDGCCWEKALADVCVDGQDRRSTVRYGGTEVRTDPGEDFAVGGGLKRTKLQMIGKS